MYIDGVKKFVDEEVENVYPCSPPSFDEEREPLMKEQVLTGTVTDYSTLWWRIMAVCVL